MKNKKQSADLGFGEFLVPIVDLLSTILVKGLKLTVDGIGYLLGKYVFDLKDKNNVVKIEREDLKSKRTTLLDEAIGYSVTRKRNLLGSEINKAAHTAIVGASGSGKTVLLDTLMYEDMKQGKPVVYVDPKGDNETLINFINLCKWTGRDYYIFSEYYTGSGSTSLNPVMDGTPTNIADRIFRSFTWSEEHYAQICRDCIEDAVIALKQYDEDVSLENIYNKILEISDPKKSDVALYSRNDVQGIISRLKKIINSDFGPHLKGPEALSFREIRQSKRCVYIGLSVLGYAEIARSIGKIILGDISYAGYDTYKTITPSNSNKLTKIGIYIDELSAVITDEFIEILNKIRGAKVELTFAFQSPSDISKINPNLCQQVLENTSNWFIFKQRMEEGANLFSESMGTMETKKQTVRVQDGEEQDQGSQRVVEELIAHHNVIKNLNVGQCVLLRHYPTRIDLINVKYIDPQVLENNIAFIKKEGPIEKKVILKPIEIHQTPFKNRGPLGVRGNQCQ